MLKIWWKRGKIAPEEQFLSLSTIFYYLMLDFYFKTGIRFSFRDKQLLEITEVEITRVDCRYTHVQNIPISPLRDPVGISTYTSLPLMPKYWDTKHHKLSICTKWKNNGFLVSQYFGTMGYLEFVTFIYTNQTVIFDVISVYLFPIATATCCPFFHTVTKRKKNLSLRLQDV